MARDSLFGESIVWTGKPAVLRTPPMYRALAGASASMALVTLLFALVVALALHANVNGMIMFAAWCALLAVGAWRLPLVWQSRVEYIVTDKHVIWRRGRLRRTIDRDAISYALIRWIAPDVGDLVLVRAVPTGALRRTLTLALSDVEAPDRLWAIVRGVEPTPRSATAIVRSRSGSTTGERVFWSAIPARAAWTVPSRA